MKKTKKLFALVLALALCFSLALPAMAADMTINGNASNHTYRAYQIFDGDLTADGVLSNIVWGSGITEANGKAIVDALLKSEAKVTYINGEGKEVTTTLAAEFASFAGLADDAKYVGAADRIASVIVTWGDNDARLDTFAEIVGANLSGTYVECTSTTKEYKLTNLDPGYYLIKDANSNDVLTNDFYTKYIIALTTDATVTVKGDVPTVEKKVSHNADSNFSEYISDQIAKTHYYQWIGTIPADIDDYEQYYYEFTDTMSNALDFIEFTEIYILSTGNVKTSIYDKAAGGIVNEAYMPDVYSAAKQQSDGPTIVTVKWTDLLKTYPTLLSADKIVVRYAAKLNENAVIGGTGNINNVVLKYSNSPSDTGYGTSVPSDAHVFAFALDVVKMDANDKTKVLQNAEFILYHYHTVNEYDDEGNLTGTKNVPMYAQVDTKTGKLTGWTENQSAATTLVTDANGQINVDGLQANLAYYLRETKAPTGYNALTADVKFIVTSYTLDENGKVNNIHYEVDGKTAVLEGNKALGGTIVIEIPNKAGAVLPSTGGIGTTMFYIVGGVLVVAAVILLITKKRMAEEK